MHWNETGNVSNKEPLVIDRDELLQRSLFQFETSSLVSADTDLIPVVSFPQILILYTSLHGTNWNQFWGDIGNLSFTNSSLVSPKDI